MIQRRGRIHCRELVQCLAYISDSHAPYGILRTEFIEQVLMINLKIMTGIKRQIAHAGDGKSVPYRLPRRVPE